MKRKKTEVFCYEEGSVTIRTLPSDYLVAARHHGRWICEPDLAVPRRMAIKCFKALLTYEIKYGSGVDLLAAITKRNQKNAN